MFSNLKALKNYYYFFFNSRTFGQKNLKFQTNSDKFGMWLPVSRWDFESVVAQWYGAGASRERLEFDSRFR
jgi:hypothetical protein